MLIPPLRPFFLWWSNYVLALPAQLLEEVKGLGVVGDKHHLVAGGGFDHSKQHVQHHHLTCNQ